MNARISVITLGVRDLDWARRFYEEGLGWTVHLEEGSWVTFLIGDGYTALALYPWDALGEDADVPPEGTVFRGVTLAYVVRSEDRGDALLSEAEAAGGSIVRSARQTEWGGYSGYFADPKGFLWEVAAGATQLPFADSSSLATESGEGGIRTLEGLTPQPV